MIYVMSDIHGNSKAFHSVLNQIKLTENDTVYILGDVIDRHPDGIEILQEIMKMPNVKMLLGNHEYMMLNSVDCNNDAEDLIEIRKIIEYLKIWYNNGGRVTHHKFDELCEDDKISIINFLHSLPINLDIEVNGDKI